MIDANLCMVNGRLGTNNITCISLKGRSVVDFCFVPYEQLGFYNNFQVITMTDAVEQYSLSVPDRLPDHSLLTAYCQNRQTYQHLMDSLLNYKVNQIMMLIPVPVT